MLDPWIIEEIRKREEEKRRPNDPLVIEAPFPEDPSNPGLGPAERDDQPKRGVVIIDL